MESRAFFRADEENSLLYDNTKWSFLNKLNSLSRNSIDAFNSIFERTMGAAACPADAGLSTEGEDIPVVGQTRVPVSIDLPTPSDKNFSRSLDIIFDSISRGHFEQVEQSSSDVGALPKNDAPATRQVETNSDHLQSRSEVKGKFPTALTAPDDGALEVCRIDEFKCRLDHAMPAISEACNVIMERGLEVPGIFYGDNIELVLPYIQKYNSGAELGLREEQDVFVVAEVLKMLISELEEHLLTKKLYPLFERIALSAKKNQTTKSKLEDLLELVPKSNLEVLRMLFSTFTGIMHRQKGVVHVKEMTSTYASMLHVSNDLFCCLLKTFS